MSTADQRRRWLELREWLIVTEATEYLTSVLSHSVTEADVYQLALDGHLRMSVSLPTEVVAKQPDGAGHRRIDGLWELEVEGTSRTQLLREIHWLRGLPDVSLEGQGGALVTRDGERLELPPNRWTTGFPPRTVSTLPAGAALVVRMTALRAFVERHAGGHASTDDLPGSPGGSSSAVATDEATTDKRSYSTQQAADVLGVSDDTIHRLRDRGETNQWSPREVVYPV